MQTGDTNYIYKNELDKACFAHEATYSDSKYVTKITAANKVLTLTQAGVGGGVGGGGGGEEMGNNS